MARKEQAEGDVSLKRVGVGGDGAAVESGSIVETVLGIGDIACVKEGARVVGMGGEVESSLASAVFQSDAAMADSAEATSAGRGGGAGAVAALVGGGAEPADDEESWAEALAWPEISAKNKTKRANRTTNPLT